MPDSFGFTLSRGMPPAMRWAVRAAINASMTQDDGGRLDEAGPNPGKGRGHHNNPDARSPGRITYADIAFPNHPKEP